ncbi:unnamed protein product [Lactuca virosa]|uniref:Uncharacterized protein n=1 Tax=Lactuca virosa TaxID=75947 RepID=A0AAU9MK17_9ASTR|nr:unnamed protein product [Lactuca virosa]
MPGRPIAKKKRDVKENNGRPRTKKKKDSTVTNGTNKGLDDDGIDIKDLFNDVEAEGDNVANVQVQEPNVGNVQVEEVNVVNIQVQEVPQVPHISELLRRIKRRKYERIVKLKLGKRVGDKHAPRNSSEKALLIR